MSIERAFAPYEGEQPYLFVSYAHADSAEVMPVLTALHERGYRIWYDEGIEAGSEWPECIAEHLAGAAVVLAFLSNAYMRSDNCRREMHFALARRIRSVNVFLEPTELTPGMELQVGNSFALMKYELEEAVFWDKLLSAQLLTETGVCGAAPEKGPRPRAGKPKKTRPAPSPDQKKRKKRRARRIVALALLVLLLAAAATLAIVGHFTGLTERVRIRLTAETVQPLPDTERVRFTEPGLEALARAVSGLEEGELTVADLAGVTELYVDGDTVSAGEGQAAFTLEAGALSDLSQLRYFTKLRKLTLHDQPLTTLETLPAGSLEVLHVTDSRLRTLQGVGGQSQLRELVTDGCPVVELGDLGHCLDLRSLSLVGASVADYTTLKPLIRLTSAAVSHTSLDKVRVLLRIGALTELRLTDSDLRGGFFKALDRERSLVSLSLEHCELSSSDNLEDFRGLTTLTLVSSGEELDWSRLAELPALSRVSIDEPMRGAIERALEGTAVEIVPVEE